MSSLNRVSPVQLTRTMTSTGSHATTHDVTLPTLTRTSSIAVESSPLTRTPSTFTSATAAAAGYVTPPPLQRTPSIFTSAAAAGYVTPPPLQRTPSTVTTTADHDIIYGEPSHTNEVCRTLFRFYGEGDIPEEYGGSIDGDTDITDMDDEEHMNQLAGIVYNINDEDFNNINDEDFNNININDGDNNININDGDFNINNMTDDDINYMNNINIFNNINNMTDDASG
jgi:hypothetical protein